MRAQGLADFANGAVCPLDTMARRARDHAEPVVAETAELRHELLGQAARERTRNIRLAQVAEGQDGEPLLGAGQCGELHAARAVHALDSRDEAVAAPMEGL